MIFKNRIYAIICSLIILLIIFTPISTFAGTHSVKSWEEYREKVKEDIKKQEENIIINFSKDLLFTSEYSARNEVEIELGKIKKSLPKYLGELNIVNIQTAVELVGSTNSPLKSVTHKMEYRSSKDNVLALNGILNEKCKEIKFKATDYEKIKEVYKYIAYEIDINNNLIKNIFSSHTDNAPAFLVAMMLSDLGYDNDIASSSELSYKWNLVKVQGLWYHVDAKNENGLLFKKDDGNWNNNLPPGEKFADEDYDKNKSEDLQVAYEIILLEELVKKAEETKLDADIKIAKEKIELIKLLDDKNKHQEKFDKINQRINALEKLLELEVSITKYIDDFSDVNKIKINRTIGNLDKAIKENFPNVIKDQYLNRLLLARNIREAIGKIIEIDISGARSAILKISDEGIKGTLSSKLDIVEAHSIIDGQISSAKGKIKSIDAETSDLSLVINEAKAYIEQAKAGLKTIKDLAYKKEKDLEIKKVESLIGVLNAVVKAETRPLKITNVTSARKSIDKLDDKEYEGIKTALITRLKNVEDKIDISLLISNAIKAVEKAEKSMKDADVEAAREIVTSIGTNPEGGNLELRLNAILAINKMEKSLANYLAVHTQENRDLLGSPISNADKAIEAIKDLNTEILVVKYANRLDLARKTRTAIDDIKKAIDDKTINTAKESITAISDSKIKSVLEKELNVIISQMDIRRKIIEITTAIELAKTSVKSDSDLNKNISDVKACEDIVKTLPTSSEKTSYQATIKELNNVINAKKIVKVMEDKLEQKSLLAKDILVAEKTIGGLKGILEKEYKKALEDRVLGLKMGLENLELIKAKDEVTKAEESTKSDIKNLSKNIATAKKTVEQISNNKGEDKIKLNNRINALESYVSALKVLEIGEKTRNVKNLNAAQESLDNFVGLVRKIVGENEDSVYNNLILDIKSRINSINNYLTGANKKLEDALNKVKEAEDEVAVDKDPSYELMQTVQSLVDQVVDNTDKTELQKRIDAIKLVNEAKLAVSRAESYLIEKNLKDAETILDKVDGKYKDIIKDLADRIILLRDQLDLSKKVTLAINLVDKATKTRTFGDISAARLAVDGIKDAQDMYNTLNQIIADLEASIKNEVGDQVAALKATKDALEGVNEENKGLFPRIDEINLAIINITPDQEDEKEAIQSIYVNIEGARLQIIKANASIARLKDKGSLLSQLEIGKKALDLSEDKLHVKEAVRLLTIVSSSINKAKVDLDKAQATLDIESAKRAIDKITHNENKTVKTTLLNTLKAFEAKLVSDNDQDLIDLAIEAVNAAADIFSKALKEDKVMVEQEKIDKAIISAKVAIIGISDTNKSAKDSLNGYINEIESMYKEEKAGVANEIYIRKAEEAVVLAESSKLEGNIRSARLRVQMIKPINPESVLKISELTLRLDVLEGKVDKTPDPSKPDPTKPDPTKPSPTKPGTTKPSGETNIIKLPSNPLPAKDREIETSKPKWGETIELKKKSPVLKFPYYY